MLCTSAIALVALSCAGAPDADTTADQPLNVVILFTDDLGYGDLSSYGSPRIETPRLDQLAREGQRWTDFYVAAPVCSPSRAALLTGRLPVRSGLYGDRLGVYFPNDPGGLPAGEVTLAERFQSFGYRTAIFGKWHLGDRPDAYPTRHGFDEWEGIPYSNDMDWELGPSFDDVVAMTLEGRGDEIAALYAERRQQYFTPRSEYWNVPVIDSRRIASQTTPGEGGSTYEDRILERSPDQSQLTGRTTERALGFLAERAADRHPFFLYVPYSMPHTPIFASEEFEGRSAGGRYGDVIEEIDWSVGQITEALVQYGLDENTLVVFSSDNGPWLSMLHHGGSAGPLNNGKGTTFEGGLRVPAIFWAPGRIAAGTTVHDIGSTLDLYATTLSLAGLPLDDATGADDSYDLSPTLLEQRESPRTEMPFYSGSELRAYRVGDHKIHFVTQGAYSMPPERTEHQRPQLFDLSSDPGERYEIGAQYPEILERLQAAVEDHRRNVEVAAPLMDARLATTGDRP